MVIIDRTSATVALRAANTGSFIAPTFYLVKGIKTIGAWNFYKTKDEAFEQLKYLSNYPNAKKVTAAGTIALKKDGTAQTAGINCDFYLPITPVQLVPVPYTILQQFIAGGIVKSSNIGVVRFTKNDGSGPYYSILDFRFFSVAATKTTATGDKLKAINDLYKEVALLKAKYNTLVTFLNELSKKELSAKEQQIFNQGMLLKDAMIQQISQIKGIEIYYSGSGTIGIIEIPIIIAIIIIAAIAGAAWTIAKIVSEHEKTKRINESYDMQKWVAAKKQEVAKSNLSEKDKTSIYKTLDEAAGTASDVIKKSTEESKSIFGEIGDLVKWGFVGLIAYQVVKK